MIYMDYSATTPMSDYALDIYSTIAKDYYGNTRSLHDVGTRPNNILAASRKKIAELLGLSSSRGIYFTSGGSESNYLALLSLARAHKHRGNHLITAPNEHPSILNTLDILKREGFEVSYVPLTEYGEVRIEEIKKLICPKTILVSIAHANAELGTVQDIEKIGAYLHKQQILFHSDCVQSFGKIPLPQHLTHVDAISVSSHKVYGPKGVGLCYINPRVQWQEAVPNTTHENGFRQGTVNVPGIGAFAAAAEETFSMMEREAERLQELQNLFRETLEGMEFVFEGHPVRRLPHHIALRVVGIEGQYVMLECNRKGFAISTGSACKVGESAPPKSMVALGRSKTEAHEFIRITFGRQTTMEQVEKLTACLLTIRGTFFAGK